MMNFTQNYVDKWIPVESDNGINWVRLSEIESASPPNITCDSGVLSVVSLRSGKEIKCVSYNPEEFIDKICDTSIIKSGAKKIFTHCKLKIGKKNEN